MTLTFDRAARFLGPRLKYAKAAGVLIWATWFVSLAAGGWEFDVIGQLMGADHLAFYTPARMVRDGRAAEVYDHVALETYERSLFPPGKWESLEAFRNPPFYALLYYPTACLPYWASSWVWVLIGLGGLVAGVRWLGPARPWRATAWAMTFLPVFSVVGYGQNSLLSFAVLCGTYRLLAAGRPFAAGLAAGLLWFKPPLLLGLVVWGLLDLRRLWPAAVGVVVTGAVLTLGSYPLVPGAWEAFVRTLGENTAFANFEWWKMHNPRAFWRLLLQGTGSLPMVLWLLSAAAGVGVFCRVWAARRGDLPAVFGASVALMLWASPHTMIYEWALAVVPAVLWWEQAPLRQRPAWVVLFAAAWAALFAGTDAGRAQEWVEQKYLGVTPAVVFQVSVPVLAWVGWEAARLLRAGAGPAEPDPGAGEPAG